MYRGSIVLKKVWLLNMLENQKLVFRSNVSDDAKHVCWGMQVVLERLLEGGVDAYDWNDVLQGVLWGSGTLKIRDLFRTVFGEPTEGHGCGDCGGLWAEAELDQQI